MHVNKCVTKQGKTTMEIENVIYNAKNRVNFQIFSIRYGQPQIEQEF